MKRIGLILLLLSAPVAAQSNIDPDHKFAWGENIGWTNWRDADSSDAGVVVGETFLSGFIWAENVGWINVGDGSPVGGVHYANTDGSDFGVNIDEVTRDLFGLAWGENIGWINFEGGAMANPPQPARFDEAECRFRGYAWGENVGWINLDDATHFVSVTPAAVYGDVNNDGDVNLDDILCLLDGFAGVFTCPGVTFDDLDIFPCGGNADINLDDILAVLDAFAGVPACPDVCL